MSEGSTPSAAEEIMRQKPAHKLLMFIASGFGAGYSPFASGTVATLVAIPIYYLLFVATGLNQQTLGHAIGYLAVVALFFFICVPISTEAELSLKQKDPHYVTIDEVIGYFAALFLVPINWQTLAASFFLFRLFDVWKPWPIRGLQSLRGGWGIMVDDLLAGVYSCVVLHIALRLIS